MKTNMLLRFLAGLFLVAGTASCDTYYNVTSDDGMYYSDNDFQSSQKTYRKENTVANRNERKKYIFEDNTLNYTQETQNEQSDSSYKYHINYNDDYDSGDQTDYLTTDPDELISAGRSYTDDNEQDVHVYVHWDNPWYWYRPRWYLHYYSPYAVVTYYYGPAYYTYYYDPFWYDWDPWCDSWYTFNYYYYGYPYYTYYGGGYYGPYGYGYGYGYPYVVYNNNYYNHVRNTTYVRGPRGGRPYGHISTVAGTSIIRNIRHNLHSHSPRNHSLRGGVRNAPVGTAGHNTIRHGRNGSVSSGIRGSRNGNHHGRIRSIRQGHSPTRNVRSTRGSQHPTRGTRQGNIRTRSGNHTRGTHTRSIRSRYQTHYNHTNNTPTRTVHSGVRVRGQVQDASANTSPSRVRSHSTTRSSRVRFTSRQTHRTSTRRSHSQRSRSGSRSYSSGRSHRSGYSSRSHFSSGRSSRSSFGSLGRSSRSSFGSSGGSRSRGSGFSGGHRGRR